MTQRKTIATLAALVLATTMLVAADYEAALSNFRAGKYVEAAAEFQALVDASPEYDFGYFMLGQSFVKMDKLDDAENAFRKAIELNGDKFEYHYGLATTYLKRKKYSQVVGTLRSAENLAPDNYKFNLYKLRGLSYAGLEKWGDAINDLEAARSLKRDEAVTEKLGAAYYNLGYHDKAIPVLKEALAASPSSESVLVRLANAQMDRAAEASSDAAKDKLYAEAQGYADKYAKLKPGSFEANNLAGRAALGAKDYAEAEKQFERVLEQKSDYCYAMVNLGKVHIAQMKWDDAEAVLEKAGKCSPRMAVIWESLGFVNQKQKDLQVAIDYYNKALAIKPSDAIRKQVEVCQQNMAIAEENAEMAAEEERQRKEAEIANQEYLEQKAKEEAWKKKTERDD